MQLDSVCAEHITTESFGLVLMPSNKKTRFSCLYFTHEPETPLSAMFQDKGQFLSALGQ